MAELIFLYFGTKGAFPVYSFQMVSALAEKKCKTTCYISEYCENLQNWLSLQDKFPDFIKVITVKTYKNKIEYLINSLNVFNFIKIAKKIEKEEAENIYIPGISLWTPIIVLFVKNKKIITTIHDPAMHKGEKNLAIQFLYDCLIKKSDKIIVLSKKFIDEISENYGIDKKNIYHIPHANFNYYKKNTELQEKIYYKILFFGRIIAYKGLIVLLKAMEIVVARKPQIKLRIAGNGEITNEEKILIEKLKNNIEYLNKWIKDEEFSEYFQDIDASVLPYVEATQSGIIPLSYSFGKPVIATNVGALSEQIFPDTGIIVEPNDEKSLSEAILSIYYDEKHLLRMGKKSFETANEILSWEHSAELLLNILLNNKQGAIN
ncbi:MAG: glycosyltransferase [Chitinispirillales bacterium]|jgi:glycosyltransferase involved in cell wall biosynthesis|nr:glycosyltransferase [Chitinispirillales bacterium]